ncbi:hypothetical protein BO82DRAFT_402015 [Aspergillus uvarum CBS 121591]|uniref:Uncharacterized protein n=1 Tax=Aspergillus uvarum CBS 121591 TaxID=1448315 RepID=A0A319CBW1_9EURO|nr:hypothetical protein BO82DRAFT_402015 [Aspergillus uvarum CBS 121591]PYH81790.1 hypothetical protein BO82DRAFT_402015 [Aspergillus uvarum CBS 121591]
MSSLLKSPVQEAVQGAVKEAVQDPTTTVIDFSKAVEQLLAGLASQPQQVLHVSVTIPEPSRRNHVSLSRDLTLWSSFCNQRGAKVLDSTEFNAYLAILNEKDIAEDNSDAYRVYLKSEKLIHHDYARSLFDRGVRASIDIQEDPRSARGFEAKGCRAVEQSRALALEDVIASIPGYQNIKQKFADILRTGRQEIFKRTKTNVITEEHRKYLNELSEAIAEGSRWRRENATTFHFASTKAGNKSEYVQEGDEVYILLTDKEGNNIREAAWLHSPEGCIGTHTDSYQETEYYWFKFSYLK